MGMSDPTTPPAPTPPAPLPPPDPPEDRDELEDEWDSLIALLDERNERVTQLEAQVAELRGNHEAHMGAHHAPPPAPTPAPTPAPSPAERHFWFKQRFKRH